MQAIASCLSLRVLCISRAFGVTPTAFLALQNSLHTLRLTECDGVNDKVCVCVCVCVVQFFPC
jgi:hypothetical protein